MDKAHPALVLFMRCKAMEWAVLPNAGGLYDQDPRLLKLWDIVFAAESEEQERKSKKRESEMSARKRQQGPSRGIARRR